MKRLAVRILGRPLRCRRCGSVVTRAIVLPWRGRIVVAGAEQACVRVVWAREDLLAFEHVDLDQCAR